MGIHNRDYFRDDAPRGSMPSAGGFSSDEWAVKWIIGLCCAAHLLQHMTGQMQGAGLSGGLTDLFELHLAGLRSLQVWRVVTYGLCHADPAHLIFNMIGVWVFGRMVERVYGSKETVAFFALAVAVSGLAHIAVSVSSSSIIHLVGASGGVFGLVVLGAMLYPRAAMQPFFLPFTIELRVIAALYVGFNVLQILTNQGGSVAHLAHLAGAAVGYIYYNSGIRLMPSGNRAGQHTSFSVGGAIAKLKPKKKPNPKHAPEVKLYEPPPEKLERDVDRLLDKINREGQDSLTPEEREILMKASESYRNRV